MNYIVFLIIVVLFGCSTPRIEERGPKSDEKMIHVQPKLPYYRQPWSNEGLDVPNWLDNPTMDGKYYAAVGSCEMSGLTHSEYRSKAYEAAISELGRSKSVKVKSVYKSYETGDGVSYIEDTTKLTSSQDIQNASIVSTWIQPHKNEYYVWVIVK